MSNDYQERIAVLREGHNAPAGFEIARILDRSYTLVGPGANYVEVFTVALRPARVAAGEDQ